MAHCCVRRLATTSRLTYRRRSGSPSAWKLSITLRDYARIGLFALREGRLEDGTQVLAEGWMRDATQPSPAAPEYGYLWWLRGDGSYRASGVFGQGISINPQEGIVIALNSARPNASTPEDTALQEALFTALTDALVGAR